MVSYRPLEFQPAAVNPLINIAVSAARAAGNLIMRSFERADQLKYEQKGLSDFVSEVDRAAEAEIVNVIRKYHRDHAILAEESGASGESDWEWIIDPLDGTSNFLHRLPHFCVSIAIRHEGEVKHGVIYAPCTQDLYIASRGVGALQNNRRIRVSRRHQLSESLIGTGAPIRHEQRIATYIPQFERVIGATAGIRRAGSAALDLAYVAAGRLDGFWELNLKPWDIAAGILLVEEAGGIVTEMNGGDVLETGNVLAATPKLHPHLAELINS